MDQARALTPDVTLHSDAYSTNDGADTLTAIITKWDAFKALDLHPLKNTLKPPFITNLSKIYPPADI